MFKNDQHKSRTTYRYDMFSMHENGLREGISQPLHRYAKANNKYMPNYGSQQVSLFLMYLDAKNLYG